MTVKLLKSDSSVQTETERLRVLRQSLYEQQAEADKAAREARFVVVRVRQYVCVRARVCVCV